MSADGKEPSFIVDHMLGSLARWLRMMGYDSLYDKLLSDNEILLIARKEGRRILTRDIELAGRGGGTPITTTDLDEQLTVVSKEYSLTFGPDRMRCSVCNGKLVAIDEDRARRSVPAKSMEAAKEFWECDSCRKVYWDGTHWKGIMDRFVRLGLTGGGSD
jgi:hypothetical protein